MHTREIIVWKNTREGWHDSFYDKRCVFPRSVFHLSFVEFTKQNLSEEDQEESNLSLSFGYMFCLSLVMLTLSRLECRLSNLLRMKVCFVHYTLSLTICLTCHGVSLFNQQTQTHCSYTCMKTYPHDVSIISYNLGIISYMTDSYINDEERISIDNRLKSVTTKGQRQTKADQSPLLSSLRTT